MNPTHLKNQKIDETSQVKPVGACDDDGSRLSKKKEHHGNIIPDRGGNEDELCKQRMEAMLLLNTATSIAESFKDLDGPGDGSGNSSCDDSKSRKRAVSLVEDSDSCSSEGTESIDAGIVPSSVVSTKRHRRTISPCMIPTKPSLGRMVSPSRKSKIEHIVPNEDVPGSIGRISQLYHQDFRPLSCAPRLPKAIVSEPFRPICPAEISEHNQYVIMHSYTVIPKPAPYQMSQRQVPRHVLRPRPLR